MFDEARRMALRQSKLRRQTAARWRRSLVWLRLARQSSAVYGLMMAAAAACPGVGMVGASANLFFGGSRWSSEPHSAIGPLCSSCGRRMLVEPQSGRSVVALEFFLSAVIAFVCPASLSHY